MSRAKRHHIVPSMHLKRFADRDGFLHVLRKSTGIIFKTKPENAFLENDLNTTYDIDGNKSDAAETFLSGWEDDARELMDVILESSRQMKPPILSSQQRVIWDQYLCLQWKRTLERTLSEENLDRIRSDTILKTIAKYGELPTKADLDYLNDPRVAQNVRVEARIAQSELLFGRLNERRLVIAAISDSSKSFVIGLNPIVPPPQFNDLQSTLWLALAPDVAISYEKAPLLGPERLIAVNSGEQVRAYNEATLEQSTEIAGRSAALVHSLARKTGISSK